MAFTNIISGTIGGNGNIINNTHFNSNLSKFQVRYNGTGSWLECSDTANITNKSNCNFEIKLKNGQTLTSMGSMFNSCSSLTSLDLSNFDTSSVNNMQYMFNGCSSLTSLNLSNFNTSQVTDMENMFHNCSSLTSLDLSSFNTDKVTIMDSTFYNCSALTSLDLSNFDVSKVTNMSNIFNNCLASNIRLLYASSSTINKLLIYLGTGIARNIYYLNATLSELTVRNDITYIKVAMKAIAKYKFNSSLYANYLPTFNAEFTGYTVEDVNNGDGTITRTITHDTLKPTTMRFGVSGEVTDREKSLLEVMECDTSNMTSMFAMFQGCSSLTSLNTSDFNTDNITNIGSMFQGCFSLTSLDLSSFNTSKVTNMSWIFGGCSSLTSLDLSSFNTSSVTNMNNAFSNCSSLTSLDVSNFNTSKVTNMSYMFNACKLLTSLDLSNFDTGKVTNMNSIFENCNSLTSLNISSWITSKVTDMAYMFNQCYVLTSLDVSSFNTSQVTNMTKMFNGCSKLTSLDLSNFDTGSVTGMGETFNGCSSLTSLDISSFDTSQVNSMNNMFYNCKSLTSLDLSNFNTSNVVRMANMFDGCSSLTSLDLSNWDTSRDASMSYMFNKCSVSDIGLLYATSSTINSLLTHLGTSVARNIYYTDAPLNELTVQDNITYKKYELKQATFPYTLNKLPNSVADYIDVVNKVRVQRVGVIEDASTLNWGMWSDNPNADGNARFVGGIPINSLPDGATINSATFMSNKLIPLTSMNTDLALYSVSNFVLVTFLGLENNTLDGFKAKMTELKPTILYPLSTPIYTPLTDEEIEQLPLSAYKDGYVMLSSDQLMPSFEFRMKASNRYQVDMLETGYYYLNAPTGDVKLGTANVDVQQMPCIVKVDNVGSGDSGYRLSTTEGFYIESTANDFVLFNQRLGADGSIVEQTDMGITDYYNISLLQNSSYIFNYNKTTNVNIYVAFYDVNKNFIETIWHDTNNAIKSTPKGSKYARLSYNMYSGLKIRMFTPITLAKLPSHRIPSSFTQGMKCGTDFGYWEGIRNAKPYSFRTRSSSEASVEEQSLTNIPELNRLEGNYQGNVIVEDEFDISTGKLTKRIGKIVLDGLIPITDSSTKILSEGYAQISISKTELGIKCKNSFSDGTYGFAMSDTASFKVDYNTLFNHMFMGTNNLVMIIKIGVLTKNGIVKYFESNPMTIYYELAVPEISYIPLSVNQVKTTTDATLVQSSKYNESYLNPQVKPSHLTYPVPSLVGNRTYTVVHNRKNITGSTKPIELNLGGTVVQLNDASSKTLVKTPSTLAHSNLIFIGGESTVDHIMVLDGDWTNKPIEYFENMKGHDTDAIITILGDGKIDDVAEQYLW